MRIHGERVQKQARFIPNPVQSQVFVGFCPWVSSSLSSSSSSSSSNSEFGIGGNSMSWAGSPIAVALAPPTRRKKKKQDVLNDVRQWRSLETEPWPRGVNFSKQFGSGVKYDDQGSDGFNPRMDPNWTGNTWTETPPHSRKYPRPILSNVHPSETADDCRRRVHVDPHPELRVMWPTPPLTRSLDVVDSDLSLNPVILGFKLLLFDNLTEA